MLLLGAVFASTLLSAQLREQHVEPCGQHRFTEKVKQEVGYNAAHQLAEDAYEAEIQQIIANQTPEMRGGSAVYVIPIVFHIVHEGGTENISDAQVQDAVFILNRDFNKQNADTSAVVSAFANIIANVGIEFRLAQYDELGACVSGITRTYSTKTNDGDRPMVDDVNRNLNNSPTNTNNVRFPRNHYLNIWVCKNADGAAGYTMTPNGFTPAKYDGIWVNHSYVGSIGTGAVQRSRTLTHEVGHWLNLSHVWGSTNNPGVSCGDDNVTDTPQTMGWNTCNINGATCGNTIDNVQNYMEYSYCSRMFTNGQKARMIAALNSTTGQRNQLWQAQNIIDAGVTGVDNLCAADFSTFNQVVCVGQSIDFTDNSFHGPSNWSWSFTGASPATSTDQNPTGIVYSAPGTYAVSLTVGNGSVTQTATKNSYITVLPYNGLGTPFSEGFESATTVPNANWFINNFDGGQAWQVSNLAAATGTNCIRLNNSAQSAGAVDEIQSVTYDMSMYGSMQLSFKYAFAYKNSSTNTDKIKVYASSDCGETWQLRRNIASTSLPTAPNTTAAFTPNSSQWVQVDVTNLAAYLVPNFMFKISFEAGGGNNVYIDDINLSGAVAVEEADNDFAFSIFPNPSSDLANLVFVLNSNETVSIELFDMLGKVVMGRNLGNLSSGEHNFSVPRGDLASGVYYVRLNVGGQSVVKKLILE